MQTHEHYEELCALAAIGQLSADEHQELSAHLRGCGLCKRAADDYAGILDQLPSATPPEVSGDTEELLSESYRQKFLQKAASAGARFTPEAAGLERSSSFVLRSRRKWHLLALAAAVSGMLAIATLIGTSRLHDKGRQRSAASPVQTETVTSESRAPRNQSPQEQTNKALTGRDSDEALDLQVRSLKQRLQQVLLERDRVEAESAILKQQLAQLKAGAEG